MVNSNRSIGRCIRCNANTRSYIGKKVTVRGQVGSVLCKHCAGALDG